MAKKKKTAKKKTAKKKTAKKKTAKKKTAKTEAQAWVADADAVGGVRSVGHAHISLIHLVDLFDEPVWDPFEGAPQLGWRLRGPDGHIAWVGLRFDGVVTEEWARGLARDATKWDVQADDEAAGRALLAWLDERS